MTSKKQPIRGPKKRKITLRVLEKASAGDPSAQASVVGRYLVLLGETLRFTAHLSPQHARLINRVWKVYTASSAERRLDLLRLIDLRANGPVFEGTDLAMHAILCAWAAETKAGPKARGASNVWELIAAWWQTHRGEHVSAATWRKTWSRTPLDAATHARPRRRRERAREDLSARPGQK